jgi:oligoendopeptidase F
MAVGAQAQPPRATPPDWDLRPVFADAAAVSAERSAIETLLPSLGRWKGRLTEPEAIRAALDLRSAVKARVARLYFYSSMRTSRDAGDSAAQAEGAAAGALFARLNEASAYMEPELVALGPSRLAALAADPRLARHQLTLEKLGRRAAHVLPAEQEAMVAGVAPLQTAPATVRDIFTNAELPWPSITVRGESRRLSPQAYRKTLNEPDRETRRRAWESFTSTLGSFKRTQAALLSSYLGGQAWEAKIRRWPRQADLITASDPLPPGAFEALTGEAEAAAKGPMQRYVALKARSMNLPVLAAYDLAAPLSPDLRRFTIEDSKRMILEAVAPLGSEYRNRLATGLSAKLMDWHPQPTKGPGATTFYVAPDIPGYVEVSFTGDYDDVAAVAHEWGHWMHWDYSRASGRPFETLLPPISVGDVPSFVHEMLLADRQIATAPDRASRIVALNAAIDALRRTYYSVVAQASFDLSVREASDRGDPLDADQVSTLYCAAQKKFAAPSVAWDQRDCLGWVSEPYVYFDLYFYRYLLATSAAAWFADRIGQGDQATIARFKTLLAAGGSAEGPKLLEAAGFEPGSRDSYKAMTQRLDRLVTQLEQELAIPK